MSGDKKRTARSDAWTATDDDLLAETVLRHIRSGSTQLKAFEEAGKQLGRTPAACGFRWNGVLRKEYREKIETAMQERKQQKQQVRSVRASRVVAASPVTMSSSRAMQEVIEFLRSFDDEYQKLRQQVEELKAERDGLAEWANRLEEQLKQRTVNAITPEQIETDTQTLFSIMQRARQLIERNNTLEGRRIAE